MSLMSLAKLKYHVYIAFILMTTIASAVSYSAPVEGTSEENSTKQINIEISAGEWSPFLSNTLPHKGVIAQLITDVFAQANIKASLTFLPWPRAYHDTLNHKYAATAVWMYEQKRSVDYLYSEPVLSERYVLFYKVKSQHNWQSLTDLKGLLIGGGLGYSYGKQFDKAIKDGVFTMSRVSTTEQNFKRLAMGRIDAFIAEQNVAYQILHNKLPELASSISHHPKAVLVNKSFVLFPKNNPNSVKLLTIFNRELLKFKHTGRYKAYFNKLSHTAYNSSTYALAE